MGEKTPRRVDPVGHNRKSHINLGLIPSGSQRQVQEQLAPLHLSADQPRGQGRQTNIASRHHAVVTTDGSTGKSSRTVNAPPTSSTIIREPWTVKHESPWISYQKGYELKFDQYVTVAVRRSPYSGRVVIRDFDAREAIYKLGILRQISHERFVTLLEVFHSENKIFAVFDHSFTSLKQVVDCAAFPSRQQLTAIISQVLEGIKHLHSIGLRHGSLTCTSVLIWPDGNVKIGNQEDCVFEHKHFSLDIHAIGTITTELMQKYRKDDGNIGVENPERWSADSSAIDFVSMTTSADSAATLLQHPFLCDPGRKQDLELLVELASITPRRLYRYRENEA